MAIVAMTFGMLASAGRAWADTSGSGNFTGTVDGPTGSALNGGDLVLWSASTSQSTGSSAPSSPETHVTIGPDGSFSATVPAGTYEFEVFPTPQSTCTSSPGGCLIPLTGTEDLASPKTGQTLTLPTPNVFGTVKDPSGAGVPGVPVTAMPAVTMMSSPSSTSSYSMSTTTAAGDGTYGLALSAPSYPANFMVTAGAPNPNPQHLVQTQINVSLSGATGASGQDITLGMANLYGTTYAHDGSVLPGVDINLSDAQGNPVFGPSGPVFAVSDHSGSYALQVPDGTGYTFSARSMGDENDGTIDGAPVVLGNHDITLPTPNVTGSVTAPDNSIVPGSWVTVTSPASGSSVPQSWTNVTGPHGIFAFTVPAGAGYSISASPPSSSSNLVSGSGTFTAPASGLTVQLRTPDLAGTVSLPQPPGGPATYAGVDLIDGNGRFVASTSTDSSGQYRFNVPAGTYTLQAQPPYGSPYGSVSQPVTITDTSSTQTVDLTLSRPDLTGRVLRPDGTTTVANAGISVYGPATNGSAPTYVIGTSSDGTGNYYLNLDPNGGPYTVVAFPPPGPDLAAGKADAVTVAASGTTQDVTLRATDIQGRVTDAAGQPVKGAAVEALDPSYNPAPDPDASMAPFGRGATFTDGNGYYGLLVPAGSWKVMAGLPTYGAQPTLGPSHATAQVASPDTAVTGVDIHLPAWTPPPYAPAQVDLGSDVGTGPVVNPVVDGAGDRVAFATSFSGTADNQTPGQLYVYDIAKGTTSLVSAAPDGTPGDGQSSDAAISSCPAGVSGCVPGQFVAFTSSASNLVAGRTVQTPDVFLRDLKTGTTTQVSLKADGSEPSGYSSSPSVSGDGQEVAFQSTASDLPGASSSDPQVYLWSGPGSASPGITNLTAPMMMSALVRPSASAATPAISAAAEPRLSADGSTVAFLGYDANGNWDVFTYNVASGALSQLGQVAAQGNAQNPPMVSLSISADGTKVLYNTAPDWAAGADATSSIELYDGSTRTELVSAGPTDGAGAISPDGSTATVISDLAHSGLDFAPGGFGSCATCPGVFTIDLTGPTTGTWRQASASASGAMVSIFNGFPTAADTGSPVVFPGTVYTPSPSGGPGGFTLVGSGLVVAPRQETTPPTWPAGSQLSTGEVGSTAVSLTWTAATDPQGVTGYRVFANGAPVASVGGTQLSAQAAGLSPNTVYTFTVQATNASGQWTTDGPSTKVTTAAGGSSATAALSAQAAPGGVVKLSWTPTSDTSVAGFRILRGVGTAAPTAVADVAVSQSSYSDTGLAASTTYNYVIHTVDAQGGEHPYSLSASATTPDLSLSSVAATADHYVQGGAAQYGSSLNIVARGEAGRSVTASVTYQPANQVLILNARGRAAARPKGAIGQTAPVTLTEDPARPGTYVGTFPLTGVAQVTAVSATLTDGAGGHSVSANAGHLPLVVGGAVKVTFDTANKLQGYLVTVLSDGSGTGGSGTVGADNTVTVYVAPASDYQVNAVSPADWTTVGHLSNVAVAPGQESDLTITPEFPTAATLILEDSHGNPLPYSWVGLVDTATQDNVGYAVTDEQGKAQFNGLKSGLTVKLDTSNAYLAVDEQMPSDFTQVLSADATQNAWTVKTVPFPTGTITGKVVDAGGKVFPNATVAVTDQLDGRSFSYNATTGNDGAFSIDAVAGTANVQVSSGQAQVVATVTVPSGGPVDTGTLQLLVPVPRSVRINVYTRPHGAAAWPSQPVSLDWRAAVHLGLDVESSNPASGWPEIGTQPTDPAYNLVTVPGQVGDPIKVCTNRAGYDYKVQDGCASGQLDAPVSADQVVGTPPGTSACYADVEGTTCDLYLSAGATLTGAVVDASGNPYAGAWAAQLCLVSGTQCAAVGQPIGGSGSSLEADGLAAGGEYEVVVTAGRSTAVGDVQVSDGGAADFGNLTLHPANHFAGDDAAVSTQASGILPGGVATLTARFPNTGSDISDLVAHILVPSGTTLDPASLVADGKAVTGTPAADGSSVDVDLGPLASGATHLLSFQLQAASAAVANTPLAAQVVAHYTDSAGTSDEYLRSATIRVTGTTLDLPSTTADSHVVAAGRAPAGWSVTLSSNGTNVGSALVSAGGFYQASVDLAAGSTPTDGQAFSVVAKATPPKGLAAPALSSAPATVTLDGSQVVATKMSIWEDEGGKKRGEHDFDPRQTPNYFPFVIVPGQDFYMQVTVNHPERVEQLWTYVGSLAVQAVKQPDGSFLAKFSGDTSIGFGGFGPLSLNIISDPAPSDVGPSTGGAAQFKSQLPPELANMTVVDSSTNPDGSTHLALNLPGNTDTSNPDLVVDMSTETSPTNYTPSADDVTAGQVTGSPLMGLQAPTQNADGSMSVSWLLPVKAASTPSARGAVSSRLPGWIGSAVDWAKGQAQQIPVVKQALTMKESPQFKAIMDHPAVTQAKNIWAKVGAVKAIKQVFDDVHNAQSSVENDPLLDKLPDLYKNRNCPQKVIDRVNGEVTVQAVGDALNNTAHAAIDLLGAYTSIETALVPGGKGGGVGAQIVSNLAKPLDWMKEYARSLSMKRMAALVDANCQPDPNSPDGTSLNDPSNPMSPGDPGGDDGVADPTGVYDPSGTLYEGVLSNPVSGATATIQYSAAATGPWSVWNATDFGQANPETTDSSGAFAWDTPTGYWRVQFTKAGYQTVYSDPVHVLPPQLGINVGMVSLTPPAVQSATADANGITVVFSQWMNVASVTNSLTVKQGSTDVAGTVTPQGPQQSPSGTNLATTFRFTPTAALNTGTPYTVAVSSLAQNYAQSIVGGQGWTKDVTLPGASTGTVGTAPAPSGSAPGTTSGAFTSPVGNGTTDTSGALTLNVPGTGATTVTLTVPKGALPAGTQVTVWKGTDSTVSGLLPGGDHYVGSYAVSWTAPDGSTTTAPGTAVTLTISDPSVRPGDLVYRDNGHGGLVPVTAQVSAGKIVITFTSDPGFVVARPTGAHRLGGADREATAIATSVSEFPTDHSAAAVVLARADDFADALAGGPLAVAKGGPLLLTSGASLDQAVAAEITRVASPSATVYLLGGPAAVSAKVETALVAMGFKTVRLAGADRYATAVAVADALGSPSTVLLATGHDFADALTGGPAAAQLHGALLLVDGTKMPAATSTYLTSHPSVTVYALGGPAASADPTATAIVGADRYATAAAVAQRFFPGATGAGLASGTSFPDALSGGVKVGALGWPVLLTDPSHLSAPAQGVLAGGPGVVWVFGGTAAVADGVANQAAGVLAQR